MKIRIHKLQKPEPEYVEALLHDQDGPVYFWGTKEALEEARNDIRIENSVNASGGDS